MAYGTEAQKQHLLSRIAAGEVEFFVGYSEPEDIPLLTHVETPPATVHEAQRTETIEEALRAKDVAPSQHLIDAAYIDAELLVRIGVSNALFAPPQPPPPSGQPPPAAAARSQRRQFPRVSGRPVGKS